MHTNMTDKELTFKEAVKIFRINFFNICLISFIVAAIASFYALKLPNIYESSSLIEIRDYQEDSSDLLRNYGGLASLAGIELNNGSNNEDLVVETIKSRDFLSLIIQNYDIEQDLFAAIGFDDSKKSIVYNEKIYSANQGKWKDGKKPDLFYLHRKYVKQLQLKSFRQHPFVEISFQHYSPYFAKDFIDIILFEANNLMRQKVINESNDSIDYLNHLSTLTINSELRAVVSSLISKEIKTQAFANLRDDYAINIIDSAIVPLEKVSPTRFLIVIIASFLGSLISYLYFLIRYLIN